MDKAGDSEELQLFRQKWKKELKKSRDKCVSEGGEDQSSNTLKCDRKENFLGNKLRCSGEEVRNLNADLGEQANFPNFHSENSCENSGSPEILEHIIEDKSTICTVNQTEPVLFSLPRPGEQRSTVGDCKRQKLQLVSAKNSKKSLIDQLIEDIDEITSIPFFDLSLPKEVGIQIFSYLRSRDLCACAQVSKSWKILAEDELIWYHEGCKLGLVQEEECSLIDRTNWKIIVQHSILEERDLRRNWKERICRLSSLEFERGGSLCAVSVHRNLVCSGYSSGTVVIWEGDDENILSYREMVTTANTQGHKPQVTSTDIHRNLCAAGFDNGDVYTWHTSLSSTPLCHCHCEGAVKRVFLSTSDPPTLAAVSDHELMVQMSDSNGQWTCIESKHYEDKISHAMFIPCSGGDSSTEHVAIATQDTASVLVPGKGLVFTFDHVIGGKLICIDCTVDRLAIGVGSYGYGTLGNKVRLYCLETTKMLSILGGHYREITCLDLANCPPHHLVTGSYDCRVRVFDLRSEKIVLSFHQGQKRAVTAVQMDDWKVVSGAEDGTLMVWDQRMTSTLWMTHARHPVRFCKFEGSRMITANIPLDKTPRENLWYADDLILHRRHRGVIRWFDFSAKNVTEGIPEICSSSYDDTSGYNYNIKLSFPYDSIEGN